MLRNRLVVWFRSSSYGIIEILFHSVAGISFVEDIIVGKAFYVKFGP